MKYAGEIQKIAKEKLGVNVSPMTLWRYSSMGLVTTKQNKNKYREFSDLSEAQALQVIMLRQVGMSSKNIKEKNMEAILTKVKRVNRISNMLLQIYGE